MKASFLLENYDVFYSKIFLKLYIAPSTLLCTPPAKLVLINQCSNQTQPEPFVIEMHSVQKECTVETMGFENRDPNLYQKS